jgi:cell division protein FtsQ
MRPMNRLARRAQAALRRPARPAWVEPARRAGLVLGGLFLVGVVAHLAWRSAPVQAAVATARAGLLSAAAREGFVVREVLAEGAAQTDRMALNQMLAPYKDQNILTVEIEEVRGRLGRLPWVREASVARELPGTLRVRLVEHRPVARWHDGRRQVLVGEGGAVIPVPSTPRYAGLPLLVGSGAPARAAELLRILAAEPELAPRVAYAQLVGGRRWNIKLDGRVEVRLPEDEPEKAWRRLAAQHRQSGLLGRAIKAVDLRHQAWLALELADELAHPAKEPGA